MYQVATGDSWASGVARPLFSDEDPSVMAFFFLYTIITSVLFCLCTIFPRPKYHQYSGMFLPICHFSLITSVLFGFYTIFPLPEYHQYLGTCLAYKPYFPPLYTISTSVPFACMPCVLQCVAVCCSVLQFVAVCCSVLQCVAVCCSVLQCVAVCCSVLQCVACMPFSLSIPSTRFVVSLYTIIITFFVVLYTLIIFFCSPIYYHHLWFPYISSSSLFPWFCIPWSLCFAALYTIIIFFFIHEPMTVYLHHILWFPYISPSLLFSWFCTPWSLCLAVLYTMGWLRLVGSLNYRSLSPKSPIKETIFCKRDV